MTIQITDAQEQQLQTLATQRGCTVDELAQEAIDHFLLYQENFIAAVGEVDEDFRRGEILSHEDVVAQMDAQVKHNNISASAQA